jgi:Zn-dependent protease
MSVHSVATVLYLAGGLLIGLVAHEFAHAWMAIRLGDQSPRVEGRLSLHPKPHVDPFGTLLLPGILLLPVLFGRLSLFPVFAYGKPYSVNPWRLRKPERDQTLIALAGPAANLLIAVACGGILRALHSPGAFGEFVVRVLQVNVILAAFNLVPLPPLDASRVLVRFLPARAAEVYRSWDQYGALFILVIFFILPGPIFAFVDAIGNGICSLVVGGRCLPIG